MFTNPPSPTFSRSSTLVAIKSRTYVFKRIPSRLAMGFLAPALLITSLVMIVLGSLLANRLEKHMTILQRLAIGFQILNYLFVAAAAIIGIHTTLRLSHKASQLFTGMLIGQLPFGIASGILCTYVVFKVTHKALSTSLAAAGATASANSTAPDPVTSMIASATTSAALDAASSTATAIATAIAAAATSMATSAAPAATDAAAAAAPPTDGDTAAAAAEGAKAVDAPPTATTSAALAAADPALATPAPEAPADPDAAEAPAPAAQDAAEAPLSARAETPVTDGANGQCPTLAGTGLVWMCKKTSLMKGLVILTYILLWFLEAVGLYAGLMYTRQLAEARKLKGEDEQEDIYANA